MVDYKVLITTSGVGSRLGELTKFTNKSLIRVGKKPAISYIVEKYPPDIEIVITLGYFGDQVKDFLTLAYPEKKFNFIYIDNFDKDGSSLAYSMMQSSSELQCPFIFHASDTIIQKSEIPRPEKNWVSYSIIDNYTNYRILDKNAFKIHDKGHIGLNTAYIGLAGIYDYEFFWKSLQKIIEQDPNNKNLSDCDSINTMIDKSWSLYQFDDWIDIGNSSELKSARQKIFDKFDILDKVDESIFLFDKFVIKFFYDKKICKNRVERCKILTGLSPKLIAYTDNFYKYEFIDGDNLSEILNENIFVNFLNWSEKNLWKQNENFDDFYKICDDFYFKKTQIRLNKFFEDNNLSDTNTKINGFDVPPISELFDKIDKNWICKTVPFQFHGDFILENIIYNKNKFILLDWRQDFGGDIKNGDLYYDLSKLNHNLLLNHKVVYQKLFEVKEDNNGIHCDILRSDIMTNCREIFHDWIKNKKLDFNKVQLITSLIWLNMSPLHDSEIGKFLFYFGKLNLYKCLKNKL
jgi:choline kinase